MTKKLTSTIRALELWKYPKSLHQGKNEKNGIAEAIPFLSCPTMFSYREAPFGRSLFFRAHPALVRLFAAAGFAGRGKDGILYINVDPLGEGVPFPA